MAIILPAHLQAPFDMLLVEWPSENEDDIRLSSSALRAYADTLDAEVVPGASGAVAHASTNNAGEHIDALNESWAEYHEPEKEEGHLQTLSTSLRALADGQDVYARFVEIVKLILIFLAAYVLLVLAWALAAAVVSGALAAIKGRAMVGVLRLFARKAVATLREKLERYFGHAVVRAVERRLRSLLRAKAPKFPAVQKGGVRAALARTGMLATAGATGWQISQNPPGRNLDPQPKSPKEGPRDGKYDLGPAKDPGISFDNPWPLDPDADPSLADRANWYKWQAFQDAEDATPGFDEAADTYRHYLSGSGEDYAIDYEQAYKDDKLIREGVDAEIRRAQANAERLYRETGQPQFQMTGEPVDIDRTDTKNWEFALGKHSVWGSGDVRVEGNQATMDVTIHAYDRYNFNNDGHWFTSENGRFEELGWARSYDTRGTLKRTVTWTIE
ncbi:WXG100-like domain-containing protein [Nonomuraea turcica]|uniref:WXG100-like domain-containing protein n=1 Tax=Nonomuraea sp. G32 TaxID=3067274 RepID=UPI00273A923B|nr:hypothetical protein [Nonomuraea sp. G32]MDP4511361.1 hypothetical protein [Nonomuraea sp. G32]